METCTNRQNQEKRGAVKGKRGRECRGGEGRGRECRGGERKRVQGGEGKGGEGRGGEGVWGRGGKRNKSMIPWLST